MGGRTVAREVDGGAVLLRGLRGGREDADDFQTLFTGGQGGGALTDAVHEMLALRLQGLVLLDVRAVHVAVVIGVMELGEGVVVRRALDADVEDLDLLLGRDVVVDDHALGPDDRHFPDLAGIEPAALDDRGAVLGEMEVHGGHVLNAGGDVRCAAAVDAVRQLLHDVEDDRDVVGGQVPGNVDVALEEAEIEPAGGNVADFPDVVVVDDLLDPADGRRIEEGVADHEDHALALGDIDQLFALGGGAGHRLFDQRVLAGEEARLGHRVVVLDGGRNHHGVQGGAVEHVVEAGVGLDVRVQGAEVLQPIFADVAHQLHLAFRDRTKIADEIRPPVAASHYPYGCRFIHSITSLRYRDSLGGLGLDGSIRPARGRLIAPCPANVEDLDKQGRDGHENDSEIEPE